MSPVRKTDPRAVIFAVATFAAGALVVVALFVFAVGKATESGRFEVNLGSDTFNAGNNKLRAESIARDGPFLLPDVGGGQRDIYLQHLGDDPTKGWLAFDARKPGSSRACQLVWTKADGTFRDSCDGSVIPGDGEGLRHHQVEVSETNDVIVDFNPERPRATAATAVPEQPERSTTSSIRVTGAG